MTLEELIAQFRIDAMDRVAPYLWSDESVTGWLNDAQAEAAVRGRLLFEDANPAVCNITVQGGTARYPLHPALYELSHVAFWREGEARGRKVSLLSTEELDRTHPGWRERTGCPEYAIQTDTSVRLAFTPNLSGVLKLEGFRLPLQPMEDEDDTPEIHHAHHRHLLNWALHRAFTVPDSETLDKDRATLAEAAFTDYFGPRPDSDLRRTGRADEPHHNIAHWV
ncbi:MAG: DUF6682 family protein [Rhodoferax sp.]